MPSPRLYAKGVSKKEFDKKQKAIERSGKGKSNSFAITTAFFNKKHGLKPKKA